MKPEKECVLLMRLIESPFKGKSIFRKNGFATRKDLEIYLGFAEKNKDFRDWFNELLNSGCLVNAGQEPRGFGNMVDVYIVVSKNIWERLKTIDTYKFISEFFRMRALAPFIIAEE